jgi:diguanylate cyclase (GGDEF)-like protein
VEIMLEWGDSPALGQKRTALDGITHSVSLTGLKPGATYHARFTTAVRETRTIFATDRDTLQATGDAAQSETITFTTPASTTAPRTFHIAPDGDDTRAGLARDSAWRTINHAASQAVAGDTVLVHTARVLRTMVRPSDVIARYGGEEFCVLLRDTDAASAAIVAGRVCDALREQNVVVETALIRVTASIGVAAADGDDTESWEALFRRADEALYRAKGAGRDRVETAGSPDSQGASSPA